MQRGALIADRFEIERHAGSGGMGDVYRAHDRLRDGAVALKVFDRRALTRSERFHREAEMLSELEHPAIVRYVAHGVTADGTYWLAMEWLEGESLRDRLARIGLTVAESVTLVRRVAEAVGAAHARQMVHRDLKPSNLLLVGGDVAAVKVIDFGLARLVDPGARLTLTGAMLGTPGYMAPEQARAVPDVDARADVFSLGCVLFRCLTGRAPFVGADMMSVLLKVVLDEAPRARELRPDVPEALDALLARLLAKSPENRPADGAAVAAELDAIGEIAGGTPGAGGEARGAITGGEVRILSAALARRPSPDDERTVRLGERAELARLDLEGAVAPYGGRLEVLADGSLVVIAAEEGAANDRATSAARSALALRRALPANVPVAVATGRGVVTNGWSAVGEVIDRAAALLRAGSKQGVAIDEVTASLLDERFEVRGGDGGLLLLGEREVPDPSRTLLGRPTPCVGRERDLAFLEATIDECIGDSVARAALVTAPAGVGKSRLCHELVRAVESRRDVALFIGRGDPVRTGAPFGVLAPAIRRAAGVLDGEPLAARRVKLAARVARHVRGLDCARVTEFLGELAGVPEGGEPGPELRAARADSILMGDQMRRAFEDFLAAECGARPVLLVLDDLHWSDAPTVKYVGSALRALAERPLCVLALARPEVLESYPDLWEGCGLVRRELRGLGRPASERLVRQVLGDAATPEVVERVTARAAGNALFLEELVRAEAAGESGGSPETVMAMVESRLHALDGEARRVLRAASVLGRVFWEEGVRALLGGERASVPLRDVLTGLCDREVLARRDTDDPALGREYVFRHELVREAAYGMLPPADRALGHVLAAAFLERSGAEPAVVGEHCERGGEPQRAARWFLLAAEKAMEANDFARVIAFAERAVACGAAGEDLGRARLRQADAHDELGESAPMKARAEEALSLLPADSLLWPMAALRLSVACGRLGHVEGSVSAAQLVHARLQDAEPTAPLLTAGAQLAYNLALSRSEALAASVLAKIESVAAPFLAEDAVLRSRLDMAYGQLALHAGRPGAAVAHFEASAAALEQAGNARMSCRAHLSVGIGRKEIGDDAAAERAFRRALALAEGLHLHNVVAAVQHNLTIVLARLGSLDEACAMGRAATAAYAARGNKRMERASLLYLAQALLAKGDLDEAERRARAAAAPLPIAPGLVAHAGAVLARVLVARGAAAEALEVSAEATRFLEEGGRLEEGEMLVRLARIEALDATGATEAAREALAEARRMLLTTARTITDAALRERFLTGIEENARILAMATARIPNADSATTD